MYSWWVDDAGADDLSNGLGLTAPPGLIYVGQAGATRWPSGRRSMNTLWSRLVGMHLDGSADFSTFRLTLASILREPLRLTHLDDSSLTTWMEDHLQVATASVDDGDRLMAVEREVLARLDPPLNLAGRPPTPLRRQLSKLRKQAGPEPVADG
ncbi:GIY-YIG nuclease family protein [Kribbella pittospori]|uniref:GIY-YIG nuclease family protein n=1 Tax=Kribbella pittospori TaxID=722689 RepID=UPI00269007B9